MVLVFLHARAVHVRACRSTLLKDRAALVAPSKDRAQPAITRAARTIPLTGIKETELALPV